MSGSSNTDIQEAPDLARLSAGERKVLELLAQGHTAKSIAGLTGQSQGAIHERLRSARRKTGVGSSRELARLLCTLENRAEKIGMSDVGPSAPFEDARAAPRPAGLASSKGPLLMFLILCAAAAATLLVQTTSSTAPGAPPTPVDDPLLGSGMFAERPNFHALHDHVRSEPRDAAWAPRAEVALRSAYEQAAQRGGKTELRVICGSTLCEAAGRIEGGRAEINAVMRAQQGRKIAENVGPGLSNLGSSYGQPPGGNKGAAFVVYWKRAGR